MNKILSFSIGIIGLVLSMTACGANKNEKVVDSNEYNNDVFTESLYHGLTEVDYWNGDEKIVITNEEDIKNIVENFTSLVLTEASDKDETIYGHQIMNLVTNDKIIGIGLLSGEIVVDNQRYYVDKNIVDSIREIALESQN